MFLKVYATPSGSKKGKGRTSKNETLVSKGRNALDRAYRAVVRVGRGKSVKPGSKGRAAKIGR